MASNPIIPVGSNDPQMETAIKLARETMRVFLEAFSQRKRNQQSFLVKVRFEEGGESEHIWLADLDFSTLPSRGVVANEGKIPRLKFMQKVEFDPAQITDWMYVEDGYLIGGFTTKVIRHRMADGEKAAFDANAPFKFLSEEADLAALKKAVSALKNRSSA